MSLADICMEISDPVEIVGPTNKMNGRGYDIMLNHLWEK